MTETINLERATDPDHDMGTYTDPSLPQWAIIREVDFRIVPNPDGDLLEFYYSQSSRDKRLTPAYTINHLLADISSPGYRFQGGPSMPRPPAKTKMSLNSKERLTYVIFKLAPRGWEYSNNGPPFKIGDRGFEAAAYYNATRYADDVAHFISDGPKAAARGTYPHLFNIYVELDVDGGGEMPIRIDPDVRHPGGSLEGEEP